MSKRIFCLIYDGFDLLDIAGPLAAFEICSYLRPPGYRTVYVTPQAGPVTSGGGARLLGERLPDSNEPFTLLIPGGFGGYDVKAVTPLLNFVRATVDAGQRVMAVGSGVRILAMTGVLDGRNVVGHWASADRLAADYPAVTVDKEHLYLRDGNIWTSAGVSAGTDVALAVVEQDYGSALARETARVLVLSLHRSGHQRQRSPILELRSRSDRFGALLVWARERLEEPLPVERLAGQASLSIRHFTRAFTAAVGVAPAKAIEQLRVDAATDAIESGLSLDDAARLAGFGSAGRMRRSFRRILGTSPRESRRPAR